jgi:transcriptional regulator with XRE-family HTH domain
MTMTSDKNQQGLNARLRSLRLERDLSLDDLAAKTGVTKGFLSLVERGLKAPSISTVMALSRAFGLPISRLFEEASHAGNAYSLVRRANRKKYAREGSLYGYKYEALAFRKDHKAMEPFIVMPPRRLPRRSFQHSGDEMVFVLTGIVETHLGSEKILLNPGDCLYFDASVPHRSRSMSKQRAVTLVVVSALGKGA